MAPLSKSIFNLAARHVNRVLGDTFIYHRHADNTEVPNLKITINRNKKIFNDIGTLVGFSIEGSIIRTDLGDIEPRQRDYFYNDNERWQVAGLTQLNVAKWYVEIESIKNG